MYVEVTSGCFSVTFRDVIRAVDVLFALVFVCLLKACNDIASQSAGPKNLAEIRLDRGELARGRH